MHAYKLKLLSMFHNIHDIFHVFFLESYQTIKDRALFFPPLIEMESEKHAEIEEILDSKVHYSNLQYLVKWLRFPVIDNKWLKTEELGIAEKYITDFYKKYPKKLLSDNLHLEKEQQQKKRKK